MDTAVKDKIIILTYMFVIKQIFQGMQNFFHNTLESQMGYDV